MSQKLGKKAKKLAAFRAEHPNCFFCGDATTTVDHVPSRACFRDKIGPEGYEFPACARCNNSAGQTEQVIALYLTMANHDGVRPTSYFEKLVSGVRNNNPEMLPTTTVSANEKRRAVRSSRFEMPPGTGFSKAPVVELPKSNREAFLLFERRLTCALYYKHLGKIVRPDDLIRTHHTPFIANAAKDLIEAAAPMMPEAVHANRQNTDIGEQFLYVWYGDAATGLFAYVAQFSRSFIFVGVVCPLDMHDGSDGYLPHSNDYAAAKRVP